MIIERIVRSDQVYAQAIRYGIVGVSNTAIGLGTIYGLMFFLNTSPFLANVLGYAVALTNSFLLNRAWTFRARSEQVGSTVFRFLAVFAVAYAFQFGTLAALLSIDANAYLSQAVGMIFYIGIGFIGNKFITFRA